MRKLGTYAALWAACMFACLLGGANAFAGSSNPDEVAQANTKLFIESTVLGRTTCASLGRQTAPAVNAAHTPAELEKCVSDLKTDADRRMKLLPSALGVQSEALKHAKDLYAFWLTSLSDLTPKDGETQEAYTARQSPNTTRLAELQKTLEAALP